MVKVGLRAQRTLLEVLRLSFSDIRKLYREDGSLKLPSEWDDDTAAAVSEFRVTELRSGGVVIGRRTRIKMFDKNSALDKAMKHLGLYENDNDQIGNSIARVFVVPPKVRGGHR